MSLDQEHLDELLKRARWPEAGSESTRRLEEFWAREWSAREPRRMWMWPVAAAATIAIGIGSLIVLVLNPPRMVPQVVSVNPTPLPAEQARAWAQARERVRAAARVRDLSQGRPLTVRERMLVGDMRPERVVLTTQKLRVQEPPAPRDPRLLADMAWEEEQPVKQRELIAEMLAGQSDVAVPLYLEMVVDAQRRQLALDALADVKDPPVQALIDELGNSRVAVRFAAARALGRIDGPVTTEQLVYLIQRNQQRREALAALLYSEGPDAAAFLDDARHVPGLASTVRAVEIQLQSVQ